MKEKKLGREFGPPPFSQSGGVGQIKYISKTKIYPVNWEQNPAHPCPSDHAYEEGGGAERGQGVMGQMGVATILCLFVFIKHRKLLFT